MAQRVECTRTTPRLVVPDTRFYSLPPHAVRPACAVVSETSTPRSRSSNLSFPVVRPFYSRSREPCSSSSTLPYAPYFLFHDPVLLLSCPMFSSEDAGSLKRRWLIPPPPFFFFFLNRFMCASGYRTPCSTSRMYMVTVVV